MSALVIGPLWATAVLLILFVAVNSLAGAAILLPRLLALIVRSMRVACRSARRAFCRYASLALRAIRETEA